MIREVGRRLHHAPGIARWAHAAAFAGIGHEVVVPAVITPGPGKAVREDAAFQIFAKRLTRICLWRVVIALPVKLPRTGGRMRCLKVFGNSLVEQRALKEWRGL